MQSKVFQEKSYGKSVILLKDKQHNCHAVQLEITHLIHQKKAAALYVQSFGKALNQSESMYKCDGTSDGDAANHVTSTLSVLFQC